VSFSAFFLARNVVSGEGFRDEKLVKIQATSKHSFILILFVIVTQNPGARWNSSGFPVTV
jgi:hypothetical protein